MQHRRFPRSLQRFIDKVKRNIALWHYQLNRYLTRNQLRARPSSGVFPPSRPLAPRGTAVQGKSHKRYTAAEVKAYLQGNLKADLERTRSIANQFQIGHLSELLNRPIPRRFYGRERLFERLSLVIVRYAQGVPPQTIADSLSCFYNIDDIEEAIDFAANVVAENLNRSNNFWF